ncbi:hypothetical protein [Rhodopirellula baltica]|uniref:Uncharacterized protein n=1 Tax=Rhodopirellula baltica SWK14 TaxID=993516 RepID=L7CAF0_RHOBT|nr:hypothetical protein [Rhodopirellula baltica]ELP30978.1 hypothetical protein RBSWK_05089 [Rhodopirellula baltica SWK14]
MSNEQYAFLRRSDLPARESLQSAIDNTPFSLTLDPAFDTASTSGFVPCTICNVDSGVEIEFDDSPELIDQFRHMTGDRDCCLVFRWGGDIIECTCAMVLSYTLAEHFDAIVSYEGEPSSDRTVLRDDTIAIHKDAKLVLQ